MEAGGTLGLLDRALELGTTELGVGARLIRVRSSSGDEGVGGVAGVGVVVVAKAGQGRIVMFGFRPQYRGQSHGTFRLLFNALLLGEPPGRR